MEPFNQNVQAFQDTLGLGHGQDTRLLYYISKFWNICGNLNLFVTTYVERSRDELFAGFCSLHWLLLTPTLQRRNRNVHNWMHMSIIFYATSGRFGL